MATSSPVDSIAVMLQSLQDNGEIDTVHELYSKWNILVKQHDISMDLRSKFDGWFLKCYKSCEEEGKQIQEENLYVLKQQYEQDLYNELREQLKASIDETTDFPVILQLQLQLSQLEAIKGEDWIKRAHLCVKEELKLMDSYRKERTDKLYMSLKKPCEVKYEEVTKKKKVLQEKLESLETLAQRYIQSSQQHEQQLSIMQDTAHLMQVLQERPSTSEGSINGLMNRNNHQETAVQRSQAELDKKFQVFLKLVQEVYNKFETLFLVLKELLEILFQEIKEWQHHLKLDYVELKATVDLEKFSPWCAKTGQLFREILSTEMPRLQHSIQSVSVEGSGMRDCSQVLASCEDLNNHFRGLQNCFYQRTFVVTEQESWCVKKKDKTQIPKVTLRVLGADGLQVLGGETVKAYFVPEDSIKGDWFFEENGCQHLNVEKINGQKIKNNTEKFLLIKKEQRYEGKFCNIILQSFDRGQRSKLVHEEKYRLLFHTCVEGFKIWTLSLPMVVTTGANQNCQCLASVMWQCFSTDVFKVPIETKTELPWSTVAEMLNTKMEKLSRRRLTEENLQHLRQRIPDLIKDEDDDPMISLTQFCVDKLDRDRVNPDDDEKCNFSFWKWFLAAYNLIEKYLLKYWENGWIEGFISKSAAERKLKDSPHCRSAMYLLRFSDSHITDSQGLKSVFGLVTAAVLMVKKVKDNQKAKTVHHLDVAGHNKLKDKPLANILLGTEDTSHHKFYMYLYPSLKPSEELFRQYASSDPVVPGYTGVRDAFIVDLEQALQKLELTGKRLQSSSSSGSGEDGYPDMKSPSLAGLKKIKRDSTDTKPSCQQTASTPPTFSCSSGSNTSSSSSSSTTSNPISQNIPMMNVSAGCPTLRTLLTKPNQLPVPISASQLDVSYPDNMVTVANTWNQDNFLPPSLPTFVTDMRGVGIQTTIQNSQNLTSCSASQTNNRVMATMEQNSSFNPLSSQTLIWPQDHFSHDSNASFMGLLQADSGLVQQPFSVSQNLQEAGALHQMSANTAAGIQQVNFVDTRGNQQTSFRGNSGNLQAGNENVDPNTTELPQNISEEYIVNFVIKCIVPKMSQVEKEKLLATLQDISEPPIEMVPLQQTPEDMVTSSSSGQLPFNQSQLEAGLESDSGQLEKNMNLFDSLVMEDNQHF